MSKFTPGPWFQSPGNSHRVLATFTHESGNDSYAAEICTVNQGQSGVQLKPEISKANARLIAAAPQMLEALESFIEFAKEDGWQNWTPRRQALLKDGQAAITAARGNDDT